VIKLGQSQEGVEKATMEVEKAKKPVVPDKPKKPKEAQVKKASDPYLKMANFLDKIAFNLEKEALFGKKVVEETVRKGPSRLRWLGVGAALGYFGPKIYDWMKRYEESRQVGTMPYSPYM